MEAYSEVEQLGQDEGPIAVARYSDIVGIKAGIPSNGWDYLHRDRRILPAKRLDRKQELKPQTHHILRTKRESTGVIRVGDAGARTRTSEYTI
jgi:hypothetical protein